MEYILPVIIVVFAFYYMNSVTKSTLKDSPLTRNQKIIVLLTLFFGMPYTFFVYYFGWKKKFPTKARDVRRYAVNFLLALIIIAVVSFLLAMFLVAINPNK